MPCQAPFPGQNIKSTKIQLYELHKSATNIKKCQLLSLLRNCRHMLSGNLILMDAGHVDIQDQQNLIRYGVEQGASQPLSPNPLLWGNIPS